MSNVGFDYSELTDFGQQIVDMVDEFPKQAKQFMRNEGQTLKRRMVKRATSELKSQPTGNYLKGFERGKKVYEWMDAKFNIRVYNSAPHAHLIEYGHRAVTSDGRDTGKFVPGKHIVENSLFAYQNEFTSHVESKLAAKIVKELEK